MTTVANTTVCIKALRVRGGLIEWNYDTPQQAARLWRQLIETGTAPDTGERLQSAMYFAKGSVKPTKEWERKTLDNLNSVSAFLGI